LTLSELADVGEILGGFAVLVSLLYLIFEVRRGNKNDRSDSAWNATLSLAALCEEIAASPQLTDVCRRSMDGDTQPEDLTETEFSQFMYAARSVLYKYEGQWYLWKEGSLSEEMWQNRRQWAKAFISMPVSGRIWESEKKHHQYCSDFIESIESATIADDVVIRA